jgi:DnaB-like helicase C terminal domain
MIQSIMDRLPQVEKLRETGLVKGDKTGFRCLDELYSVKQGTYTIIYSEPTHGKSEFTFEICLNQAELKGKRSLICSPETGTVDEIIAELVHKVTGKQIYKTEIYHTDDGEFMKAMEWLSYLFIIVDTDEKSYSIPELFEIADRWEKDNPNETIDIIVGEPYNELDHSLMSVNFGARQDLYIEDLMSKVRRACRKKNKMGKMRHFILTVHPSAAATPVVKDGVTTYPKPLPRQAAGGQALYRKAMTWITLWRPPQGYKNEHGQECKENEVHISIDKAKPKGVSFRGKCKLFFDWKKNRYYEDINFGMYYAFKHEEINKEEPIRKITIVPSVLFNSMIPINQLEELATVPQNNIDEDPF